MLILLSLKKKGILKFRKKVFKWLVLNFFVSKQDDKFSLNKFRSIRKFTVLSQVKSACICHCLQMRWHKHKTTFGF